jgi:bifunctional non-homologous end joining protein LigD
VAQIAFTEWTADDKLRQPVFLGLRHDKKATECTWSTREAEGRGSTLAAQTLPGTT